MSVFLYSTPYIKHRPRKKFYSRCPNVLLTTAERCPRCGYLLSTNRKSSKRIKILGGVNDKKEKGKGKGKER
jgi:hypothetical protein